MRSCYHDSTDRLPDWKCCLKEVEETHDFCSYLLSLPLFTSFFLERGSYCLSFLSSACPLSREDVRNLLFLFFLCHRPGFDVISVEQPNPLLSCCLLNYSLFFLLIFVRRNTIMIAYAIMFGYLATTPFWHLFHRHIDYGILIWFSTKFLDLHNDMLHVASFSFSTPPFLDFTYQSQITLFK
ncbi:unnamed protein product [Acanthosepion pharaonis]|uniref:Uncharacterized protein n=1 Tax=Acanthosepion pharaonis TaxID=158019 RepID=A0A812B886_ACAPH|nr:unnamed protein product [Sepia pharaonis]